MATVQEQILSLTRILDTRTKKYQAINGVAAELAIASSTNATPIEITTSVSHLLKTGDQVHVKDHLVNTNANNTLANPNWTITKVDATKFTLDNSVGNGVGVATGDVTPALVGTIDGEKFQKERLLDAYNQARLLAFGELEKEEEEAELFKRIGGVLIENSTFQFAGGVATLPAGWVRNADLFDVDDAPILILDTGFMAVVRAGKNKNFIESATNRFVFRLGNTLQSESGNTYVTDLSTYRFRYWGLPSFTLTDVIENTTLEGFNGQDLQKLIEIAQMVALEKGTNETNAVTKKLFGGQ